MKIVRFAALMMIGTLFLPSPNPAAQFNFTPIVTVSEEYNDNIYLTSRDTKDDFITRTSVGFSASLLGRTSGLELNYLPAYEWYADYSENDGWTQDATARLYKDFSPSSHLELTSAYLRTNDPIGNSLATTSNDPLVAPEIAVDYNRRGRNVYDNYASTLRLDQQFGAEDSFYTALRYSMLRGVDLVGVPDDVNDNNIWTPSVGGTYWFTNFWGIEGDVSYANIDYKVKDDLWQGYGRLRLNRRLNRHLSVYGQYAHTIVDYTEGLSSDYQVYEPTVGFNYQLDQNTRIDIGVGWYFQNFDRGEDQDGFLLNALADKVWPFRRGLVGVTLLAGTNIDNQGVVNAGFQQYYAVQTRAEYAFTPRFSSNANVGYRWNEYPDRNPNLTEKILSAGAGLEYQALRWMFLNLDYTYTDFVSDISLNEYTENRVIFSITFTPDQPFRANW